MFAYMKHDEKELYDMMTAYMRHADIFGDYSTISSVVQPMSRFNLYAVLQRLSRISSCITAGNEVPGAEFIIQDELRKLYFSPELQEKILSTYQQRGWKDNHPTDKPVPLFHRHQLLMMLKFALIACPEEGGIGATSAWSSEDTHLLGAVALRVNDLAGAETIEDNPDRHILEVSLNVLTSVDYAFDNELMPMFGRAQQFWIELPKDARVQSDPKFVPFAQRFFECHGITLENFLHSLFIVNTRSIGFDPAKEKFPVIEIDRYKESLNLPDGIFEKSVSMVSLTPRKMAERIFMGQSQSFRTDMTVLREFPLLEVHPGTHLIHDQIYMARFLTEGIYHVFVNTLTGQEKEDFQSLYGSIYALYLEKLLEAAFAAKQHKEKQKITVSPMFHKANAEVCDIFIESCSDSWVLIEAKGSFFTTQGKYSGSYSAFKDNVDAKFGSVDSKRPKGVAQLANSIKKILLGEKFSVTGADLSKCDSIYPVLVANDTAAVVPGMRIHLEEVFRTLLGPTPPNMPVVRPLTVLSTQDLERYAAVAKRHALSHVLASFHHWTWKETGGMNNFISRDDRYRNDTDVTSTFFHTSFMALSNEVLRVALSPNSVDDDDANLSVTVPEAAQDEAIPTMEKTGDSAATPVETLSQMPEEKTRNTKTRREKRGRRG